MTDREALQDLASSDGWRIVKEHARHELAQRLQIVLNRASGDDRAEDIGLALRGHIKASDIVRALLDWPEARILELERKEARQ